jgi:phosphodiesterase/alkaline phosphatase D-like protein
MIMMIPSAAGTLANSAGITETPTDPNTANNTASVSTTVNPPASTTITINVAPIVLTGLASEITSSRATISGAVNPAGLATKYVFELGKTKSYGTKVGAGSLAAGTNQQGVLTKVKGLKANTTYHYRLDATSAKGTTRGQDKTFKTAKAKPKKKKK